jgi:hypothetical protein
VWLAGMADELNPSIEAEAVIPPWVDPPNTMKEYLKRILEGS